jgi:DNA-binding transcriptional LysR family regulator
MPNPFNEMSVFARVAERGSIAGAAEDVGLSASAVSKLITRLEIRLGVRLINRTTRHLALTAEGQTYLKRTREILGAIDAAEAEIASSRTSPRGHLRVLAPPVLGRASWPRAAGLSGAPSARNTGFSGRQPPG